MNSNQLFEQIQKKRSFLCVGLDTDMEKIPSHLKELEDPIFEFNKQIVDATQKYTVAYKPNIAFYEAHGVKGWESLQKTAEYIKKNYPEQFLIADAKRGDIGNTSKMYAKTFFEIMNFDSVTVAPYMGEDSVTPFLSYKNKWVILLGLTSNVGADDFQFSGNPPLYQQVIKKAQYWASPDELMFVAGATRAIMLGEIRKLAPDNFLLVPGVGAQGGSLAEVADYGMNSKCGLLVNSSRGIIYADSSENFAVVAGQKALELRDEMDQLLNRFCK
ncbi:MAG: orotidine-5'-phosphate decarboxylase [Salinivirgaceae bacterium]|jgi:orotidine-5'-phosphate decarboxylase|nr:orotidine-5'-phosphate decarboxylase [Salinivirgaceae bacterium]